jgi:hypothetical protein
MKHLKDVPGVIWEVLEASNACQFTMKNIVNLNVVNETSISCICNYNFLENV